MRKRKAEKRTNRSFQPHVIATKLHEAVTRDLTANSKGRLPHHTLLSSNQTDEFLKKFTWGDLTSNGATKGDLEAKTFEKFLNVNTHMAAFMDIDVPLTDRIQSHTPFHEKVLLRARALMRSTLGYIEEDEMYARGRNSNGTSIGVPFSDTSNERKFTFPITVTEKCAPLLSRCMLYNEELSNAVKEFNRNYPIGDMVEIVQGSRATTVDKTDKIRRMIAIEPTGNMFLQQGLMSILYDRMAAVGLDVRYLPEDHRRRAQVASITGREATIDWTSASDCVSIGLLRWLLPPSWFDLLNKVRCDEITLNGAQVPLNMFSTMGNAGTFPLETLVFWTLGKAVEMSQMPGNSLFPEWEDNEVSVSVFGDDCIVRSEIASQFIETCQRYGFILNDEKSFYDGLPGFRESCGGDFLQGYSVRPFHLRGPTSDRLSSLEPWLYTIVNGLIPKYKSVFGSLNWVYNASFLRVVSSLFREYGFTLKCVPPDYPDDCGLLQSQDLQRLTSCYPFVVSPVAYSDQGTSEFKFLRFQYRRKDRYQRDDAISYQLWQRRVNFDPATTGHRASEFSESWLEATRRRNMSHLPASVPRMVKWNNIRRVGGYVVARDRKSVV